jgi:hypothetical protein
MLQEKNKVDSHAIVNMPPKGKYIDIKAVVEAVENLTKDGKDFLLEDAMDLIFSNQLPDMDSEELCRYLTNKFKEK